ncbi:putative C2H2 finger domain protein [Aspergillus lucknowensis]|uniref:C2H2-type domain-containing protein n=1 Tax=Aspergillus lucknowensis TaxID=176173 RepID=A0ABR4LK55_9EURO
MRNTTALKLKIETSPVSKPVIEMPSIKIEPQASSSENAVVESPLNDEPKPPPKIHCTYPNCSSVFSTINEMNKHKRTDPEHEYCAKCDLDFETQEQLLIHMIKTKKHIVCPVCGIEYQSEGGRDAHIRLFHRTAQNLVCYGCKMTFRSASGLMRHIENGECPEITQDQLQFEQSKRILLKEALDVASTVGLPLPRAEEGSGSDNEEAGGVPITQSLLEANREAMANQPMFGGNDEDTTVSTQLVDKHWPKLARQGDTGLEDAMSDLMVFTQTSTSKNRDGDQESTSWKGKGRELSIAGSELTYRSHSTTVSTIEPPDPAIQLRQMYKDWKPENFFDPFTGEYVCACGKRCRTEKAFEQHVLSKNKGNRRMQCPGCLRTFKSTAALIAHCESSSTRCDVNEGNQYAQIIDEVSGGMIRMVGYNEDGTQKYEAGEVELKKTVTIGTKWCAIDRELILKSPW